MTAVECGAAAMLTPGGPAPVPFRLCCVFAMLQATGPTPASFVCTAELVVDEAQVPVAEPASRSSC